MDILQVSDRLYPGLGRGTLEIVLGVDLAIPWRMGVGLSVITWEVLCG
jgi:hypothetical protein